MKKRSGWLHNIILFLCSVIAAVLLLEGLFRLVPTWFMDYRSNLVYIPDEAAGIRLKPGQSVSAASMCYKISPVVVNSAGFRDREPVKGRYDIAVLGDSYMEAAQIPEGLYLSRLLEKIMGVNVLSGAISGYGTIHEYYCYREYMAAHRPRVVLLFFSGNDIEDNGCKTSMMKGVLCAETVKDGGIVISPSNGRLIQFKEWIRTTCKSCYGVAKLWITLKTTFAEYWSRSAKPAGPGPAPSAVTPAPAPPSRPAGVSEGWVITEHFLLKLKDEVSRNGGTLVVLPVSGQDPNTVGRLVEVCRNHGIPFIPLHGVLAQYQKEFKLPPPYFLYRCDAHWNPLAHFLAANEVSRTLVKEKLITVRDEAAILATTAANLHMSPTAVLGDEAYAEIYKGGYYRGKSSIPAIIARETAGSSGEAGTTPPK